MSASATEHGPLRATVEVCKHQLATYVYFCPFIL